MHDEHGLTHFEEEKILRFFYGWDYDPEVTEQKLLEHHEFMTKYDTYDISDERVAEA